VNVVDLTTQEVILSNKIAMDAQKTRVNVQLVLLDINLSQVHALNVVIMNVVQQSIILETLESIALDAKKEQVNVVLA